VTDTKHIKKCHFCHLFIVYVALCILLSDVCVRFCDLFYCHLLCRKI